jgi:DNA-binding transcriptional LysR family regulator
LVLPDRLLLADRVQSLFQEQIDLGLRIGALPDSSLVAVRLGTTRRVVCASPAYLATRGTPSTPEDLAGHDCVTYAGFMSPDVWTFFKDKAAVAVSVRARLVVGSAEAAVMQHALASELRPPSPNISRQP